MYLLTVNNHQVKIPVRQTRQFALSSQQSFDFCHLGVWSQRNMDPPTKLSKRQMDGRWRFKELFFKNICANRIFQLVRQWLRGANDERWAVIWVAFANYLASRANERFTWTETVCHPLTPAVTFYTPRINIVSNQVFTLLNSEIK